MVETPGGAEVNHSWSTVWDRPHLDERSGSRRLHEMMVSPNFCFWLARSSSEPVMLLSLQCTALVLISMPRGCWVPEGYLGSQISQRIGSSREKGRKKTAMTDVGEIIKALNDFGRFQHWLVLMLTIASPFAGFHMFSQLFMVIPVPHHCNTNWLDTIHLNLTEEEKLNLTIPRNPDGTLEQCLMYTPVETNLETILQTGLNSTEKCRDGWVYPSKPKPSLVTQKLPRAEIPSLWAAAHHQASSLSELADDFVHAHPQSCEQWGTRHAHTPF
ncbi:Solute carrier family 22 member 14, partial [Ophiophagus hannah]